MKKTWVRKTLSVGVLAAGALLLAPAAVAQADVDQATFGNFGALNGTQVAMPVTVPVNLVGNSAAVAGAAQSFGIGANEVESAGVGNGTRQTSFNNKGFLNGTQVGVPVTVPVNVAGNAAAVAGKAGATGIAANRVESSKTAENGCADVVLYDPCGPAVPVGSSGVDQVSFGNYGTLNGTQVAVPVTIPVNACGNSLALIGGASATGICANKVGGGYARPALHPFESAKKQAKRTESGSGLWGGSSVNSINQGSFHNYGTLNGTQVAAPITVPVNACGNSLGVLGYASATGICANHVGSGVAFRKPVQWVKPLVPVYEVPGYVLDDECDDWATVPDKANDGIKGNNGKGPKGDDVKGDGDGYGCTGDDDDVRGDNGGYPTPDDQAGDDAGYDDGGNRDDVPGYPADDIAGDTEVPPADQGDEIPGDDVVNDDQYGAKTGGRDAENSPVSGLTKKLGGGGTAGLAGIDLLSPLG